MANEMVHLQLRLKKYSCWHFVDAGTAMSDKKGMFSFSNLCQGQYRTKLFSDRYVADNKLIKLVKKYPLLKMKCKLGASIGGKVRGEKNQPIPKVQVGVKTGLHENKYAFTDHEGNYSIGGLHSKEYKVTIKKDGFVLADGQIDHITLKGNERTDLNIQLKLAGTLTVHFGGIESHEKLPDTISVKLLSELCAICNPYTLAELIFVL